MKNIYKSIRIKNIPAKNGGRKPNLLGKLVLWFVNKQLAKGVTKNQVDKYVLTLKKYSFVL